MWNKFLSGFNEIPHAVLRGARVSYNLISYDHTDIGSIDAPFANVFADNLYNRWGEMSINSILTQPPLITSATNGIADISLSIDPSTLSITNGQLTVKNLATVAGSDTPLQFDSPLLLTPPSQQGQPSIVSVAYDDHTISLNASGQLQSSILQGNSPLSVDPQQLTISLLFDDTLELDDKNQLKVSASLLEGSGPISVITDPLEFTNLSWAPALGYIKLSYSGDFTTINGSLCLASQGAGNIPYYALESGFSTSPDIFYYNSTSGTLHVPSLTITDSQSILQNTSVPSKGYLSRYLTTSPNTPIQLSPEELDRRTLSLNVGPGLSQAGGVLSIGLSSTNAGILVDNEVGSLTLDLIGGNGILVEDNVVSLDIVPGEGLVTYGNAWSAPIVAGEGVMVVWVPELGYEISAMPLQMKKPSSENDPPETTPPAQQGTLTSSQGAPLGTGVSGSVITTGSFIPGVLPVISPDFIGSTLVGAGAIFGIGSVLGGLGALGAIFGVPPMVTIWGSNPRHDQPKLDGNGNIIQPLQPQLDANGNVIPVGNNSVSIGIDADGNAYLFEDTPIGFDAVSWLNGQGLGAAIVPNLSMVGNAITGLGQQLYGNQIETNTTSISSLQTSVNTIQGKQTTDESNIATNTTNIATIQGKQTTDESNIANLASSVAGLSSSLAGTSSSVSTIQVKQATDETNIATNTTNIATIQGKQTTDESNIATNTTNISTIQGKQATDESNIATNTTNIATIQGKQTTDESNIATLQSTISNIPAANFSSGQYTNLKNEIKAAGIITVSFDDLHQWVTIGNSTSPSFVQGTFSSTLNPTSSTSTTGAVSVTQGGIYVAQNVYASTPPSVGQHLTNKTYTDATYQKIITASSPLSLSGSNVLSIDLSQYLTVSSASGTYQPKLTAQSPLILDTSSTLSVNTGQITTVGTLTSLSVTGNATLGSGSSLVLSGLTSGTLSLKVPNSVSSFTITLPGSGPAVSNSAIICNTSGITGYSPLGSLAGKSSVDWNTTDVINKPTLGALAAKSSVDWNTTDVINKPTLGALAAKSSISLSSGSTDYTGILPSGSVDLSGCQPLNATLTSLGGSTPTLTNALTLNGILRTLTFGNSGSGSHDQYGIRMYQPGNTFTSTTSGSTNLYNPFYIGTSTLNCSAATTVGTVANLWIEGCPLPGTNVSFARSYGLFINTVSTPPPGVTNPGGAYGACILGGMNTHSICPYGTNQFNCGDPNNYWLNTYTKNLYVSGNLFNSLVPNANATLDLGSSSLSFRTLYCQGITASGGTVTVPSPVNGTDCARKDYVDSLSYLTASTGLTKSGASLSVNAAQPGITSLGTLTGLTCSGVLSITNTTASTSVSTGALTVSGGLGVGGTIYGGNMFIGTNPVASQLWVTNQNYQPLLTAGTGLTLSGNTLSVNASQTLSSLTVSGTLNISTSTDNSFTITDSAGAVGVNGYSHASLFLKSSMSSGECFNIGIGQANNTKNLGYLGFVYNSSGSNSNYLTLGLYSSDRLLNLYADGHIGVTNTTDAISTDRTVGALVVSGGVGVAHSGSFGGSLWAQGSVWSYGGQIVAQNGTTQTYLGYYNTDSSNSGCLQVYQNGLFGSAYNLYIQPSGGNVNIGLSASSDGIVNLGGAPQGNSHRLIMTGSAGSSQFGFIAFYYGGSKVGNIITQGSSTSFNTTSDYRIKQNAVDLTNACDRLSQIPVYRFNFVGHSQTVDGMFAHEVQSVVPESITGHKDEVDEHGEPVLQGIDQSKLVPLLIASTKELITSVNVLIERVSALEKKK